MAPLYKSALFNEKSQENHRRHDAEEPFFKKIFEDSEGENRKICKVRDYWMLQIPI